MKLHINEAQVYHTITVNDKIAKFISDLFPLKFDLERQGHTLHIGQGQVQSVLHESGVQMAALSKFEDNPIQK